MKKKQKKENYLNNKSLNELLDSLEKCLITTNLIEAEKISNKLQNMIEISSPLFEQLKIQNLRLYILQGKFQIALDSAKYLESKYSGSSIAKIHLYKAQAKENLGFSLKDVLSEYLLAANSAEKSKDYNTLANSLSCASSSYIALGKTNLAISALNEAIEYSEYLTINSRAKLHGNMGILMQRTGSLSDAVYHYERAIEIGKQCENSQIQANALSYLGHVKIDMGEKENGINMYETALALHKKHGNKRGECITLGNLGGVQARYGETDKSISNLNKAINIAEEIGHTKGIITFRANLGLAYKLAGKYKIAYKQLMESKRMVAITEDKRALAICHLNLAGVLAETHKIQTAIDEARLSLRLSCATNALITQAKALCTLGWLMLKSDRLEMGINFFKESSKRFLASDDHSALIASVVGESSALHDKGEHSSAMKKYNEAILLREKYNIDIESKRDLLKLEKKLGIQIE